MLRNLIFGATLCALAGSSAWVLTPRSGRADAAGAAALHADRGAQPAGPLRFSVALLAQREQARGGWRMIPPRQLARGDQLQLTIKVAEPGYLMVAMADARGHAMQLLYPQPGQTGEVRADLAYALPGPTESYVMDGEPSRLLVQVLRDPLPARQQDRTAILRAARRRDWPAAGSGAPIYLELRDGAQVRVTPHQQQGFVELEL